MDNVVPFRRPPEMPVGNPQLLIWAAEIYAQTINTPLAPHTRVMLESGLALAAIKGEDEQYDEFIAWAEQLPVATRAMLTEELDRMAECTSMSCMNGNTAQAALLSIPVTIVTDHPTADLRSSACALLRGSMRRNRLLDGTADVVVMPWLTREPAERHHPVRRLRLLQTLTGSLSSGLSPDYAKLAASCRPEEEPEGITERTTCARYLTVALFTSGDARDLSERIWRDYQYHEQVTEWLVELSEHLTVSGSYEFAIAGLPVPPSEADIEGNLLRVGTELAMFIGDTASTEGYPPPAECEVVMRPEYQDLVKTHVHVSYLHRGQALKTIRVALPTVKAFEHVCLVDHAVAGSVYAAVEDAGVGQVQDICKREL
jgi:hypothetical protein